MNRSIDDIWKTGFSGDMALSEPTRLDLYNQKSNNLVDKFERLLTNNHKVVLWAALIILIALSVIGAPILGTLISLLLIAVVYIGKRQLNASKKHSQRPKLPSLFKGI